MNTGSLFRLLILSAIWGSSFLFMRIGALALGPVALMESRVLLAALFLAGVTALLHRPLGWRAHWRHYLILGLFNSALPFLLYGYAAASNYAKSARSVEPLANAHGSMWGASLAMAPLLPFFPAPAAPDVGIAAAVLALGVVCSGVAYLLYFRLIDEIGAAPALTVTFLIPLFGVLWGWLFLDEAVGWHTLAGGAVVVVGTALVTGFSPRLLRAGKGV